MATLDEILEAENSMLKARSHFDYLVHDRACQIVRSLDNTFSNLESVSFEGSGEDCRATIIYESVCWGESQQEGISVPAKMFSCEDIDLQTEILEHKKKAAELVAEHHKKELERAARAQELRDRAQYESLRKKFELP